MLSERNCDRCISPEGIGASSQDESSFAPSRGNAVSVTKDPS